MAFYMWKQNNSGGSFVVDNQLTHRVVIEADSFEEAESKAFDFGIYYDGVFEGRDCPCCGDRWYSGDMITLPKTFKDYTYDKYYNITGSVDHVLDDLHSYLQYLTDNYGWESPDARVFYKDGSIQEYFKSKSR